MIATFKKYFKISETLKPIKLTPSTLVVFVLVNLASCSNMNTDNDPQAVTDMFTDFERKIAQKMALDIRYFCSDSQEKNIPCRDGVTKLPQALADLVEETDIGGVVLFAENLENNKQIIQLTNDLQNAALKSKSAKPLIISIDQEGGRVVRLPHATSFAGNMAIGATYAKNQTKFSTTINQVIGSELRALGINNNYAPVLDVNTNPNNPVINTRSYGENPQSVAELGAAAVNALQAQGVMATLKHFPGHGDTSVDSHLALPRVEHDLTTIENVDLAPFKWAITHSEPAMIMTAHIQYPALDNTTFISKTGKETIIPATMSRKILTDLLRNKMAYKGIVATDALDMAGVAHYYDQVTATVETISAGADLVIMPFKVRRPEDVKLFKKFVTEVSNKLLVKIADEQLSLHEIDNSITRLNKYKAKYIQLPTISITAQIDKANDIVANSQHIAAQQLLSDEATTILKQKVKTFPVAVDKVKHIHVLVENAQEQKALQAAIVKHWQNAGQSKIKITSIVGDDKKALAQIQNISQLLTADIVITTVNLKKSSVVDLGGIDDLIKETVNNYKSGQVMLSNNKALYGQLVKLQLEVAKQQNVQTLLIAQGSPFLVEPYAESADNVLLTYDDKVIVHENNVVSTGMNTSIAITIGAQQAKGVLPARL